MNAPPCNAPMVSGFDPRQADMAIPLPQPLLHLAPVGGQAIALDFDGGRLASDAGVVLLKDSDDQRGFTRDLAAVLSDPREARRVKVTLPALLKPRVYHIAAGYEDANDANTLRDDPIFKLLRDRLPESGAPLASQPTLSRFENRVSRTALSRMARVVLEHYIASYDTAPTLLVLDVDDPEERGHGHQEHARYDGYYGGYGFLPLPRYAGLSGRLITTLLKATRCTGAQRLAVLQRVGKRLRQAWPDTLVIVRGDSHFASPEVRQWIDEQPALRYVTGLTSNAVVQELAREVVAQAKRAYACSGHKVTRFHSTRSQAGTWSRARRVVIKVEVCEQGVNTRFVVTALEQARTQVLYQHMYCARGQAENESTDHKRSVNAERTSCHRVAANQFRVFLHAAAYVLLATLRREV
jgi:Transposase DDE domain group 1